MPSPHLGKPSRTVFWPEEEEIINKAIPTSFVNWQSLSVRALEV